MDSIQLMNGGGSLALSTGSRDLRPRNLKIVISQASFAFLVRALLGDVFVFGSGAVRDPVRSSTRSRGGLSGLSLACCVWKYLEIPSNTLKIRGNT